MKIEKVSENQIKCILSREDLASRHLRISELAYGSDKARELFQDMMQQAQYELGFEAENLPLMIEAIPVSGDCLVLVVTKVDDPDELDTRFSNFSSFRGDHTEEEHTTTSMADEILECFGQLGALLGKSRDASQKDDSVSIETDKESTQPTPSVLMAKVFSFADLNTVTALSKLISPYYFGESTLYKDETENRYYLVVFMSDHTPEEFSRICNVISEYGSPEKSSPAALSYLAEHFSVILSKDAVQTLTIL